jgi:hypothetical protein
MKVTRSQPKPIATSGGSFKVRDDALVQISGGTRDHPDGNAPRAAEPASRRALPDDTKPAGKSSSEKDSADKA